MIGYLALAHQQYKLAVLTNLKYTTVAIQRYAIWIRSYHISSMVAHHSLSSLQTIWLQSAALDNLNTLFRDPPLDLVIM